MRYHVNNNLISKRKKCLKSDIKFRDVKSYLNRIDTPNMKTKFFSECACSDNANTYYKECLEIIANESSPDKQKELATKFNDNILPYVENLSYVEYYLSTLRENISKTVRNSIDNRIKRLEMCDQILKNHDVICEKFNTDQFVEEKKNKGVRSIVKEICKFVHEEANDWARCQQFSVALSEASYVLQKNSIPYNGKALTRAATEYFLMLPENTQQDMYTYKNVLITNECIRDKDLGTVSYFLELYDTTNSQIILNINRFKTSTDKDFYAFCDFVKNIPNDGVIERSDFLNHFGVLLTFVQEFLLDTQYDSETLLQAIVSIAYIIEEQMHMNPTAYTREELDQLAYFYTNQIELIDAELADVPDSDKADGLIKYKDCCNRSIAILDTLRGMVYPKDALTNMSEMAILVENSTPYYLEEFKIFRFNTILKAAAEAEKFIETKGKALMDKIAGFRLRKKHKKLSETSVYECLTENDTCDICVGYFDFSESNKLYEIHDVMTEMCTYINKNIIPLKDRNLIKCYYVANENYAEIHIEDASTIFVNENDRTEINENLYYTDEFKERCLELEATANLLETINVDFIENIISYTESKMNNISEEAMVTLIDTMVFVENVTDKDINNIANSYINSHPDSDYKITKAVTRYVSESYEYIPLEIQMEACNIISSLLESDEEKEKINKEKEEKVKAEDEKEKKRSFIDKIKEKHQENKEKKPKVEEDGTAHSGEFLNNLKLFSKGLKAKMKDMSNKEKEISRNLDMNFNRLYRGCKDVLTTDRREAIIKGSIIPSFSKSIKLAIGLAGITALNPVAGAVTAIGGVAMSKHLTNKERLLLLDEIDTELEVLEEEISNAKSKNNMKKLRKLLQYKKDLQRQYQRIKYNVRIGKDLLPGSTVGIKDKE